MSKKIDGRRVSLAVLEEKRRAAHRLRERGMTRVEIGEIVGIHADTIGQWLKLDQGALGYRRPGRKVGSGRRLNEEQEQRIKKLLIDKTPDQLKMAYALWTRESVRELIRTRDGVDLPVRTVGDYLRRWGMTPQKPQKRAYEQRAPQVQAWLSEEYPAIVAQAKREDAEIYWGDETGLRSDCQHERGYALKGKTPVIRLNAKRESINMISALTNQGKVRFRLFEGTMNAGLLIDFMMRLLKDAQRKVYLILDNLRVHHAKLVKEWLAQHNKMIQVFYLPAYSPELNPDEYLNCDLKAGVHSGLPAHSKAELKHKASKYLRMLQRRPKRVRKYFQHEKIRHAA
jgi:transposase